MPELNDRIIHEMTGILKEHFAFDAAPDLFRLEKPRDPSHGDLACTAGLTLAKVLRKPPMAIATALAQGLKKHEHLGEVFSEINAVPPGFINLRYADDYILQTVRSCYQDPRFGVAPAADPMTVVVDFSCPNVAKPMHVGHIRSTILGASLVRIFRFLGHTTISDNHLGDWGTQFGMIILGLKRSGRLSDLDNATVQDIAAIYRTISAESDANPDTAEAARQEVVKLHHGDPENRRIWERVMRISMKELDRTYARLGISFDQVLGESFYESMLPDVVEDLRRKGIARDSEGAVAVFFENEKYTPFLIRKSDGAFLYPTTDLATIRYRLQTWNPDLIVYVTDARQQLHFNQLFETARMWGCTDVRLEHIWFGSILGEDGKPFKTRAGDVVGLDDLLDEAQERARAVVDQKSASLPPEERERIAQVVGMGALKYADLSQNRTSDYVFSWDKLLSLVGNTAPYMQYAYARVRSIFRRGDEDAEALRRDPAPILVDRPQELALARTLMDFGSVVELAAREFRPNFLTAYLYELAGAFSVFYDSCPVLKAPDPELRRSRLMLCDHTALVIRQGLELLGIETIEQM